MKTECQATPCDMIRATNEERDRICTIIEAHLGGAYPDRAIAIIDAIHGADHADYQRGNALKEAIVAWVQTMPLFVYAEQLRVSQLMLALELLELNRRVIAYEVHERRG